jgi:hypothetical protein
MKLIRTSVTITPARIKKIKKCLLLRDLTLTELLSCLFIKGTAFIESRPSLFKNIEYQPRGEKYIIKKVRLYQDDREFLSVFRHVYKVSVSLILRVAIDEFLDDIIENGIDEKDCCDHILGGRDNYPDTDVKVGSFRILIVQKGRKWSYQLNTEEKKE